MKDDNKLARWLNDGMDKQELEAFMASPDFEIYDRIKKYSAQLTVPETDMDALYNRISQNRSREKRSRIRTLSPWLSRIAAVLVLALCVTYYFYTTRTTTQFAATGERTEFVLPDNSTVMLNSGSTAEYRPWNWEGKRIVELEGEAFFKVAKGETFDVITPQGKVTVVGTQFNVRSREGRLEVACFEGKVKVSAGNESLLLTPGKSVIFEKGKIMDMPNDENLSPGWLNYEPVFESESLAGVIAEMERQYNIKIVLKGKQPKKGFSGSIPMNDLNSALESIKVTYHLKAERTGSTIVLSTE